MIVLEIPRLQTVFSTSYASMAVISKLFTYKRWQGYLRHQETSMPDGHSQTWNFFLLIVSSDFRRMKVDNYQKYASGY